MARSKESPANFYEVLGIQKSASTEDVRRAYKQKALETHPDKLDPSASEKDIKDAEERFRLVNEAFKVLSDVHRRRVYDMYMSSRSTARDWSQFSEEQARRMRDREAWARKAEEEHKQRMVAIREQKRLAREQVLKKKQEAEQYKDIVERMFQQLCDLNPEWEERKRLVQQRQTERMQLERSQRRRPMS